MGNDSGYSVDFVVNAEKYESYYFRTLSRTLRQRALLNKVQIEQDEYTFTLTGDKTKVKTALIGLSQHGELKNEKE